MTEGRTTQCGLSKQGWQVVYTGLDFAGFRKQKCTAYDENGQLDKIPPKGEPIQILEMKKKNVSLHHGFPHSQLTS